MAKEKYDFSEETIKKKRKYPFGATFILIVLVALQVVCVLVAIFNKEEPKDLIKSYKVYVTPRDDGSLDIEYEFVWQALDNEPLSWVEIGMANGNFVFLSGHSGNIKRLLNDSEGGYAYAKIYFTREYSDGETFTFSFKVNQRDMLTEDRGNMLYEFIPGWFNYIEVEKYEFNWKKSDRVKGTNANRETVDWYVWDGTFGYGDYRSLKVRYKDFNAPTSPYREPETDAYNGLKSDESGIKVAMVLAIILIGVFEMVVIDAYVSYVRGRGFLRGYGHHMHVYGRRNPHYTAAYNAHQSSRGGSRGGGCACACACACAGGGRAGCSQKDTYKNKPDDQ